MTMGKSSDAERLFHEIKQAAKASVPQPVSASNHGDRSLPSIPNYQLGQELHRGGQGVVYRALQLSTKRTVAIKLILKGAFATQRERFRFEREIELASRLDHPHIVTIFDGGMAGQQPFYAMEYVAGTSLNELRMDSWSQPRAQELVQLFKNICQAVGYAHSRGVIHRDLKPANILVDQQGQPKILDFGLAKIADGDQAIPHQLHTATGEFLGTLSYASPEQAKAAPDLVDARSDVYSLGLILYELLTGQLPYDVGSSVMDTLKHIVEVDPISPSSLRPELPVDLETILLKCLSKEPERRYQSARLLADDLQRFLEGRPVDARRDSTWYVVRKTVQRHRGMAMAAAAVLLLLVASTVVISLLYFQAATDRDAARLARNAESSLRVKEAKLREVSEFQTYVARIAAAEASLRTYAAHDVLRNLYQAHPRYQSWEYWYLFRENNLSRLTLGFRDRQQFGHHGQILAVDYHPSQRWLVSASRDGTVVLWDAKSGELVDRWETGRAIKSIDFHPVDDLLAIGFIEGEVAIVEVQLGPEQLTDWAKHRFQFSTGELGVTELSFDPSGRRLLVGAGSHGQPGKVLVLDWQADQVLADIPNLEQPVLSIAWAPAGNQIAFADSQVHIYDLSQQKVVQRFSGHGSWINDVTFRPDGKELISCANEPAAKLWDVDSGELIRTLHGHSSFVNAAAYSPDGKRLATASRDATLRIWNARNGDPLQVLWGQFSGVSDVAFGPDNRHVVSCGDWSVKTWDVNERRQSSFGAAWHQRIRDLEFASDSNSLFTCDERGFVYEIDLIQRKIKRTLQTPQQNPTAVRSMALSSSNERLYWAGDNHRITTFHLLRDEIEQWSGHRNAVTSLFLSHDGQYLYSTSDDRALRRWDLASKESTVIWEDRNPLKNVIESPCRRWLAISSDREMLILDQASLKPVMTIPRVRAYKEDGYAMAFDPKGNMLVAPEGLDSAFAWSVPSGEQIGQFVQHSQPIQSIAVSPDGRRIVTASREGTVKLWDTEHFDVVLTLRGFNGYAELVTFSPDGNRLVGALYDGALRVWDAMPESERPQE